MNSLARTELGTWNVQGVDYGYTLQGWMKYINGPALNEKADIGRDGDVSVPGFINERVSRDVMSYAIDYFGGDYKPIQTGSPLDFTTSIPQNMGTGKDLFNGNIRATTVHLSQLGGAKTYSYSYDQLNRIVKMRKHETSFTYTGSGIPAITVASPTTEYQENITYDANGNIKSYQRNGNASQLAMDNLDYVYNDLVNNRLLYVTDSENANNYSEDVDNQNSGNYDYDNIGNLVKDVDEGIDKIEWTVYGKIKRITIQKEGMDPWTIDYEYDAMGNRIYKRIFVNQQYSHTFYVRDAQGNTLAVYTKEHFDPTKWAEQHLYGSSRVGMVNLNMSVPAHVSWPTPGNTMQDGFDYGKTVYELSNHLGNVMATITDQKDAVQNGSTGVVGYYKAVSMTQTDYYPFGMQMVGRTYRLLGGYRYGFNGKENDDEVKGVEGSQQDYGMRIYDPRIGKFLSVDPLQRQFPFYSPYHYAGNSPIKFIDLDGGEPKDYIDNWIPKPLGYFKTNILVDAAYGTNNSSLMVDAPGLGWIQVTQIYDEVSQQNWFVHHNSATGKDYYYHANNGQHNVLSVKQQSKGLPVISSGYFVEFQTRDKEEAALRAKTTNELMDAMGVFWYFSIAGSIATQGQMWRWLYYSFIEEAVGVPIINSPDDLVKNRTKKEINEEISEEVPWEKISGIVRDASKGKGNFNLGSGTYDEAIEAGKSWVGEGFKIASDGKTMISANGLRQFRPPSFKPKLRKIQANFEWRNENKGQWQGNGHLDILEK